MRAPIWITTEELCRRLANSRSTLFVIKRGGLLKPGRHLLCHQQRCELALGRES